MNAYASSHMGTWQAQGQRIPTRDGVRLLDTEGQKRLLDSALQHLTPAQQAEVRSSMRPEGKPASPETLNLIGRLITQM